MPVARIRIFGFYFHLDFGYFILFVYRMQQKLIGILSVATDALGVRKEMLCCRLIRVQHPL
jgi:hypothetical protein